MPRKTDFANAFLHAKNAASLAKMKEAQEKADRKREHELAKVKESSARVERMMLRQEKERRRQSSNRRWLQEFSEASDSILALDDVVLQFQQLADLFSTRDYKRVSAADFEDFQFQQHYLEIKGRVERAFSDAEKELGEANVGLLAGFKVLLPVIKKVGKEFVQARNDAWHERPSDELISHWRTSLNDLLEFTCQLRELDTKADKVQLELHPDYEFVELAEQFPQRFELDAFILKCAVLVIKADKKIDRKEQLAFDDLRRSLMFPSAEADEIFETTRQIKRSEFTGSEEDALGLVHALAGFVFADGAVGEKELAIFKAISKAVGVTESKRDELFQQVAEDPSNRPFDGNKLIQAFKDSSFKDTKNLYYGKDIPQKLLDSVGFSKVEGEAKEEFPVVSYTSRFLGLTTGNILVTDNNVYVMSGGKVPTSLNLKEVEVIEKVESLSGDTYIKTRDQEIVVPNFFKSFLEILRCELPQFAQKAD